MNKHLLTGFFFLIVTVFIACAPKRNLSYFTDLSPTGSTLLNTQVIEPVIQIDDVLAITVNTLNPETNQLFNSGTAPSIVGNSSAGGSTVQSPPTDGYTVDKDGQVNLPVMGKIKVAGLTINAATDTITSRIEKTVNHPIVNVKFVNFKITVIGEVNKPGTFVLPDKKIDLLGALGLAGDITVFGKRENILLIREKEGQREIVHLDLTKKDIISSPYFYLKQNDVIYIEPAPVKESQTNLNYRTVGIALSVISILVVILSRL